MTTYTYTTLTRQDDEARYTFAEVKYDKIVSINQHWVPLEEYIKFFEADACFLDITGVLIDGEPPAIGDSVTTNPDGYEIRHFKSTFSVAETKNYKTELLKLERDRKELEPIEYNGILFDADKTSLTRMDKAEKFLVKKNIPSIVWTTADNSRVEVTVDDFEGINAVLAMRSDSLHNRYNELKAYIDGLDDKYLAVILEIDWNWDINTNLDEKLLELTGQDGNSVSAVIEEENENLEQSE